MRKPYWRTNLQRFVEWRWVRLVPRRCNWSPKTLGYTATCYKWIHIIFEFQYIFFFYLLQFNYMNWLYMQTYSNEKWFAYISLSCLLELCQCFSCGTVASTIACKWISAQDSSPAEAEKASEIPEVREWKWLKQTETSQPEHWIANSCIFVSVDNVSKLIDVFNMYVCMMCWFINTLTNIKTHWLFMGE